MPIYEYQCSACGHQFEALQKASDAALVDCPVCEGTTLRKKISAPAFRLSGTGWYETDFKTDKDKRRNLAGDKGPDSGKADPGKSDSGKSGAAAAPATPATKSTGSGPSTSTSTSSQAST
jgi:putative FmdB family regulatory protein